MTSKKKYRWIPNWLKRWFYRHRPKIIVSILFLLLFVFFFWDRIFIPIYPGQAGVLWSRLGGGTVLDRTFKEGFHIIWPWNRMYIYDIRIQQIDGKVFMLSSNGLFIEVDYSARFAPKRDMLPILHQNIGPDYVERVVRPEVVSALRRVIGNYKPEDIYAMDEWGLLQEIARAAETEIHSRYINLDAVLLLELKLPVDLQNAINAKLTQEQLAQSYQYRLDRERQELERRRIEAEGIRQFEMISGISILKWRGIEATENLAKSPNAKFIVIGTDSNSLPVILNMEK